MEPPQKRARLDRAPYDDDDDDEICMDPEEFRARQDPGYQLDRSRAKAAFKLKSTFEHIFEKYEKDFTDIGDEIDLNTGEIVVDNGHLRSLDDKVDGASDIQSSRQPELATQARSEADSLEEEERILHGSRKEDSSTTMVSRPSFVPQARPAAGAWGSMSSLLGGAHRLSNLFTPRLSFMERPLSFGSFGRSANDLVDPAWRVPDIPMPLLTNRFSQQFRRTAPPRPVVRKTLPIAPYNADVDDPDEDDLLLGVSQSKPFGVQSDQSRPLPNGNESGAVDRHVEEPLEDGGTAEAENDVIPSSQEADREKVAPAKRGRKRKFDPALNGSEVTNTKAHPPAVKPRKPSDVKAPPTSRTSVSSRSTTGCEDLGRRLPTPEPEPGPDSELEWSTTRRCPSVELDARRSQNDGGSRSNPEDTQSNTTNKIRRRKPKPTDRHLASQKRLAGTSSSSLSGERDLPIHSAKEQLVIEIVERRPTPPPVTRSNSWERRPSGEAEMDPPQEELKARSTEQSLLEVDGPASPDRTELVPDSQPEPQQTPQLGSSRHQAQQKDVPETFSRNVLDPSYAFSDEEGPAPRKPVKRGSPQKQEPKQRLGAGGAKSGTTKSQTRAVRGVAIDSDIVPSTVPVPRDSITTADDNTPRKDSRMGPSQVKTPEEGSASAKRQGVVIRYSKKNKKPAKETPRAVKTHTPQPETSDSLPSRKRQSPEPETPQAQIQRKSPTSNPPPSKDGITSLVSDCDEDELSLGPDDFTPGGSRRASFPREHPRAQSASASMRKKTLKRSFLFGKPRTPASAVRAKRDPSLSGGGSGLPLHRRGREGGVQSSPVPSPTGSLVQTPNGTMRRCGVDGFRCDRDFCFVCL